MEGSREKAGIPFRKPLKWSEKKITMVQTKVLARTIISSNNAHI